MSDLVKRLRGRDTGSDLLYYTRDPLCIEAADRIEQLERELDTERENNAAELELRLQTQTDLRHARALLAEEKALADRLYNSKQYGQHDPHSDEAYREARGL